MEDPVPVLTRRHFEIGMSMSRPSVSETDLSRYDDFKRKYDPTFVVKGQGGQNQATYINWGDNEAQSKVNKNDDLDLYS